MDRAGLKIEQVGSRGPPADPRPEIDGIRAALGRRGTASKRGESMAGRLSQ